MIKIFILLVMWDNHHIRSDVPIVVGHYPTAAECIKAGNYLLANGYQQANCVPAYDPAR